MTKQSRKTHAQKPRTRKLIPAQIPLYCAIDGCTEQLGTISFAQFSEKDAAAVELIIRGPLTIETITKFRSSKRHASCSGDVMALVRQLESALDGHLCEACTPEPLDDSPDGDE